MYQLPRPPADAEPCLCGSGQRYGECCGPLLKGLRPAETPAALMRSRYSAFVHAAADYLLETWHPSTRPAVLALDDQPQWQRLEVLGAGQSADGLRGWVEFAAYYQTPAGPGCLRERSRFLREQGRWQYLDGTHPPDARTASPRVGRNALCPCGSGRKFKQCCGR